MSALGQKLPRGAMRGASALPPKAAAAVADECVRFGPKADSKRYWPFTRSLSDASTCR
jgi:hypothetical protein